MRRFLIFLILAAGLIAANPALASKASAATVPSFGHVFVIVGENKSLSQLSVHSARCTT